MTEKIEWFVGIDWASQRHQVCLIDAHGECLGERAFAHGGLGMAQLRRRARESSPQNQRCAMQHVTNSVFGQRSTPAPCDRIIRARGAGFRAHLNQLWAPLRRGACDVDSEGAD